MSVYHGLHHARRHLRASGAPRWTLTRKTAPAEKLLSLDEAFDHLRLDPEGSPPTTPDAALVQSYIDAVTAEIDGADGWLGRALVTQTWQLKLHWFPWRIRLPLPPLQSVSAITYVDTAGAVQTVDAADYIVSKSDSDPAFVEPAFGKTWPATRDVPDAVTVEYVCGYGDAADVPELIRNYARVRLGQFYEHRELVAIGVSVAAVPYLRDSLEVFRRSVVPL